ncbi:MAG: MBL fold metallo-hydrolase [Candidatus Accumulibacter sp.]|jgi:metallo-beta-lactamase family protein|nr:MBL fold metallo-hydrolase [Accumulibacter sp.]
MRIGFFGAAGEVTGSCNLVETDSCRFLVDCGMFQGGREAYSKNVNALNFDFDVREIDFVLLTHAHIDHSGLLPRLTVMGFRGPIYATLATVDLLKILLPDSAHIQEKESEWQLRHQRRGNTPQTRVVQPLYTVQQAATALSYLRPVPFGAEFNASETVRARFHEAGHILGSAWIEVTAAEKGHSRKLVFSGDLGMSDRPVIHDPEKVVPEADLLLVESTYGNRRHRPIDETEDEIVSAFEHVRATQGNLVIPSFAVGRTQEIIYILADLVRRNRIDPIKIYVDSPMATSATRVTLDHQELLDDEAIALRAWAEQHPDKVKVEFVGDANASRALNEVRSGAVIVSASGMCDAGRIKYHLRENLPRAECCVLITGFQAKGTMGRRLVDGAPFVRLFGQTVPVRARIHTVGGLSAHADQPALIDWLRGFRKPPKHTFVVHGEPGASQAFVAAIKEELGWKNPRLPQQGEFVRV